MNVCHSTDENMHHELSVTLEATVVADYNISKDKCGIYPRTEHPRSYGSNEMENTTLFGLEIGVIV